MQRFKLANVLLGVEDFLANDPEAFYRAEEGSTCEYDEAHDVLAISGLVDFATYFNGVSSVKWRRYADIDQAFLHIELAGDACTVAVRALCGDGPEGPVSSEVVDVVEVDADGAFRPYDIAMPADATVAGFAIMSSGTVRVRNAYYYAEVDQARIRPVRLAVCTTTFRKEDFIVPNIGRIKEGVLGCDDPIAENFHLFVVDNGRTLNAEQLSDDRVSVIPNPNVGGSGGFARGMMAAQDDERGFTHVILMDDDVRMSVESFKRTYALLSLVTDEYALACINGAMLELERPWLQYEDVAYVRAVGGFNRIKGDMRIADERVVARNELIDVEFVPGCRTYGAWWYSCIPMELVKRHGLPMPFFVRCDDVEYGSRVHAKYMTMNGICIWHARFGSRFSAPVHCYQYVRNMLTTMALHPDFFDQRVFMVRYWRTFNHLMRTMDYDTAELWLDGLDDYLKGPAFLKQTDGAKLLGELGARAEKFIPVSQLDPEIADQLSYDNAWLERPEGYEESSLKRLLVTVPHDRHWFPDFMLSDKPGVIAPGYASYSPWTETAMRSRLVAMSADGQNVHVRTMDRARYKALTGRFLALAKRYTEEGASMAEKWAASLDDLSSRAFWEGYLKDMSE